MTLVTLVPYVNEAMYDPGLHSPDITPKSNSDGLINDYTERRNVRKVNKLVKDGVFDEDQGGEYMDKINKNRGDSNAQKNLEGLLNTIEKKHKGERRRLY